MEVKGHRRRGANAHDLLKVSRHALNYERTEHRQPSKTIYVSNGQFGLPPSARDLPYSSAPDLVNEFGNQGGLVIATTTLFQLWKHELDRAAARTLIRESVGLLTYHD